LLRWAVEEGDPRQYPEEGYFVLIKGRNAIKSTSI
jgi:hypothetical protein